MKRANEERPRTLRVWGEHRAEHVSQATGLAGWFPGFRPEDLVICVCDNQAGRFRKGQRAHGGCSDICCKWGKLLKIAKKYGLFVVEDACHAILAHDEIGRASCRERV